MASVTYIANAVDPSNASSYTFSGVSFGAADANRYIIVGVGSSEATDAGTPVTIGGVTATKIVEVGSGPVSSLWIANVPTGTTGDIVVTLGATALRCGIGVWGTILTSAIPNSFDSDFVAYSLNPTASTSLSVPASGFAIGYALNGNDDATAYSWTGATERFEAVIEANAKHSGASDDFAGATSLTLSVDLTNNEAVALVAAAWPQSTTPVAGSSDNNWLLMGV